MRQIQIAVLLVFAFSGGDLALADYQDGLDAYSAGDYSRAMEEWQAVADSDSGEVVPTVYAEAHYAVAKLYWLGQGVPRDYYKSYDWLIRAAELGHAGAQAKLGYMFTDGLAVAQDYDQALEWFEKAARAGDVDGLYNMGIFYLYGWGVETDRTMAKQYFAAGSALGDPESEAALQQLQQEEAAGEAQRKAEYEDFLAQMPSRRKVPEIQLMELPEAYESQYGVIGDEIWIMEQNSGYYTIQVMALSSLEKLQDVVSGYEQSLNPLAAYRLQNDGQPLFVLVQGSYENVETARQARDAFPSRVQRPSQVWVRRFEMVQELIRLEGQR